MNYVVTVNGEKYEVEVERVGGGSSSLSRRPPERVSRPVQAAPAAQPAAPAAPQPARKADKDIPGEVGATLSGSVVKVLAEKGGRVKKGEPVIVTEAMKMETEIVSEVAGSVAAVRVKKGDAVDTDTVLVEVK